MAGKKTYSAAEKYERQKALARERQRRRKTRKTEEEIEAKKKYDRERQARLRAEKKIKSVADMTPREHRKIQKYWRERNKIRSEKKKAAAAIEDLTPPCCPGPSEVRELSCQKKRGCKQVRQDKAKAYRKIEKLRNKIKQLERALEKYKKRYQREKLKSKSSPSTSPKRLVSQTIVREKVSPKIKKQLFLGFCLQKQIQHQIKNSVGSKKKNQQLHKVLGNEKLKQYRVQKYFRHIVPYTANKILNKSSDASEYTRKSRTSIRKQLSDALVHFYEDDRISRMYPGKKDVIRKGSHKNNVGFY